MENMFFNCSSLVSLDFTNIQTYRDTNLQNMFYNCSSLVSLKLENSKISKMTPEFLNLNNLCSLNIIYSDQERNKTFFDFIEDNIKQFKGLTVFVSYDNPYLSKYSFLKKNPIILYRETDVCLPYCSNGSFGTTYSCCLKKCPKDYFNETYKNISREFNNRGKTIKEIVIPSQLIDNIRQCYFKFISCKKGDPEGVPLDNKCEITNTSNQCENNYKIDPFKSTNCIPQSGYWYIDQYKYIMNLDKCPTDKPYIINGTNQCVGRCDNKLEYSYNGTFYYLTDNGKYFHSNKK